MTTTYGRCPRTRGLIVALLATLWAAAPLAAVQAQPVARVEAQSPPAATTAERTLTAQATQPRAPVLRPPGTRPPQATSEARNRERVNAGTLGLAAGQLEGAPLRFATELARVLDDGDNLRVLPIVTRGIFDNIFDLLYLRGVDAAIVYGDVLEHFKRDPSIAGITRRINFVMPLFPSEVHVFARPEIKSLEDLAGKKVNFNTQGTAAAYTGPILFDRLGIQVQKTFDPHPVAMAAMQKSDAYAALVFVSSKPLAPLTRPKFPDGFKFLPVPHSDKLDYYQPAYLEAADYPSLIPADQRIPTVAVPAVLAVYDWPADTERHRRVVRMVDVLFERFYRLQTEPGYHPKWKDLNLAAKVPGWQRFRPVEERLERAAQARASGIDIALARQQVERTAPGNAGEQERLFKQFLEWRARQARQ